MEIIEYIILFYIIIKNMINDYYLKHQNSCVDSDDDMFCRLGEYIYNQNN